MTKKKTSEEFAVQFSKLVGDEYNILECYHKAHSKIKLRHNNISCGYYEYLVTPNSFLKGAKCPKCSGKMKKTQYVVN